MPSQINPDDCISCGACAAECPNAAISQGDASYDVSAEKCDDCKANGGNALCMATCPVDAISKA
ncbi:MAG: 4Fe-4S binding protein [Myxococcales bacterium]|nr:4Fe-4S binding protein [Myxococcales bacterium]